MLKAKYNYKDEIRVLRQEAREEGLEIGLARGLKKGIEKGIEKGRAEGMVEVVRVMKRKGFSVKDIADILEFPQEKIEQL